jgi:hypothetical protein
MGPLFVADKDVAVHLEKFDIMFSYLTPEWYYTSYDICHAMEYTTIM